MLDGDVLPPGLTRMSGWHLTGCPVSDPSAGRETPCALTAGGSDLVGAWLEAPSLSCPTVGLCVPALLTATERTGMTTMTSTAPAVIGGVDTHADVHVAAACDQLGAVLGTQAFPTTGARLPAAAAVAARLR